MSYNYPLVAEGISKSEINTLIEVIKSGKLTMGERVSEFEQNFAKKLNVRNAVMVNSGSSANLLALEALVRSSTSSRFKASREDLYIAVPSVLWPTTIWPIIQLGFKALVVDVKKGSLEIDLEAIIEAKKQFKDKLVGVFIIHPLGKYVDFSVLTEKFSNEELFIIEDTCESLGARHENSFAGTFGLAGTYSFYFSHHITTIEGGMVVTNDDNLGDDLRSMRAHGWTRNRRDRGIWESTFEDHNEDFIFVTSGYNFRPTEIQGALGISQLARLDHFIKKRQEIALAVTVVAENQINLQLVASEYARSPDIRQGHSWMAFPFLTPSSDIREKVLGHFRKHKIQTRPILAGNFLRQRASKNPNINVYKDVINAESVHKTGFMIGNHHSLSKKQIQSLLNCIDSLKL